MSNKKNNSDDDIDIVNLGKAYQRSLDDFQGTLMLNPVAYKKYCDAHAMLKKFTDENNGKMHRLKLNPVERSGFLLAEVPSIHLCRNKLDEFIEMLKKIDVISVYVTKGEMIEIGATINNVHVEI